MQIENCTLQNSIIINQDIVVTILDIKASRVKLGVQTPEGINVHRKEVHKRMEKERTTSKGENY
jgi:carbon storage regulator CsrA